MLAHTLNANPNPTEIMKITDKHIDNVNGTIIGGDHVIAGLFYDGRQQGGRICANTGNEAIKTGRTMRDEYVRKFSGHPCYLYPDAQLWEVRIFS